MNDIIYKKECYDIIGCCFDVFNSLGPGLREKNYQDALEEVLSSKSVDFKSQLYVPIMINDKLIGKYYLDLLVGDKIAVELKVGDHFHRRDIEQLYAYLKYESLQLGLLVVFTSNGVNYKRIVNLHK